MINTVLSGDIKSNKDNCRFFIFQPLTCSPGRLTQNVNSIWIHGHSSIPLPRSSHFDHFRIMTTSPKEDTFWQQNDAFLQQTNRTSPCRHNHSAFPDNPHNRHPHQVPALIRVALYCFCMQTSQGLIRATFRIQERLSQEVRRLTHAEARDERHQHC